MLILFVYALRSDKVCMCMCVLVLVDVAYASIAFAAVAFTVVAFADVTLFSATASSDALIPCDVVTLLYLYFIQCILLCV